MGPLGTAGSLDDLLFAALSGAVFGIVYVAWRRLYLHDWVEAFVTPRMSAAPDTVRHIGVVVAGCAIATIAAVIVWLPVLLMAIAVDAI